MRVIFNLPEVNVTEPLSTTHSSNKSASSQTDTADWVTLRGEIEAWANELGFDGFGVADTQIEEDSRYLSAWLDEGLQGDMDWMAAHGDKRHKPESLVPGTIRVISVRLNYLNDELETAKALLDHPQKAYISRYALGRDYHKTVRNRLNKLAKRIEERVGQYGYRVFADSAPVLEKALARNAGLGWIGKHTLLINPKQGSLFFLGEIFTDLPLPVTEVFEKHHCGSCTKCIEICPTDAIVAPNKLDARRCISYLTIEYKDSIPLEMRPLIGNRIFGCDDCQLLCPWNRYAEPSREADFAPRHGLDQVDLVELFMWDEATFEERTAGMPLRRAGYELWLRNIAVALGNAKTSDAVIQALQARLDNCSDLVREHIEWALQQHST
ncbi:MAG: tRNA epoxyqueuosine(34) reductase QueG [Gammaproteobacteria bacterium]|nr:tRNA epoxyqueuosine(34) reductase QueG [Gammaproteobacteria bacterium]